MIQQIALLVLGTLLVVLTLVDVFATIIVPGPSRTHLRVAVRLVRLMLPLARRSARGIRSPGSRPSNSFAPAVSVLAAGAWLTLLLIGYGIIFFALRADFFPPLHGLADAFYFAGSSLLTLGISEVDAHHAARWVLLLSALSGFGVITATITFVLQIQAGLHAREPMVLAIADLAGRPPSGIALLETHASLGLDDRLAALFADGRGWATVLLHSHYSFPVLAFFHSTDAENDWLVALEALLDAATIVMALAPGHPACGAATLLHRSGSRTTARLCDAFDLKPEADPRADEDLAPLADRLADSGYALAANRTHALHRLRLLRGDYAPRIRSLSTHLGADHTRLLPPTRTDR